MKRSLILPLLLATAVALPAAAQTMSIGASIGVSESFDDGFRFRLDDQVTEIWIGTELDFDTTLKLRGGRLETDDGPAIGGGGSREGTVDYIDALVEYRFSEIFGSSGVYLGPGFYRQRYGIVEESDWGLAAGVNGQFPVTRRFALVLDLGYHWVNFEDSYDFVTATGGFRFGF